MTNERFTFSVDKAGRHWIWDRVGQCNVAVKAKTREEAIIEALTMLSNSYYRVLAERSAAQAIADKIREIVCPEKD